MVPEAEVRMVEGTYEDTKSRVLCGSGVSGEYKVNVGLKQGSVFVPDKQKDLYKGLYILTKLLNADADGSNSGWGSKYPRTADRVDIFSRHRLSVRLQKTEVMWWHIEGKSCKYAWMGRS